MAEMIATPVAAPLTSDLEVSGMNCASCVSHVQKAARGVPGVQACEVNLATGRAAVRFDPAQTNPQQIADAISHSGYTAVPLHERYDKANIEEQRIARQMREANAWLSRAVVGVALWLPVETIHWVRQIFRIGSHHLAAHRSWMVWAALISSTIALVYIGSRFYVSAWKALLHRTSNMDTLISIGASVAYLYSLVYFAGGWTGWWRPPMEHDLYFMEASGLLALISLGHWLEARARHSAGRAVRELMNLAPPTAMRIVGGEGDAAFEEVAAESLEVGDRILIRPGDRVPADGAVIDGRSSVDESMITGEPIPATRVAGDAVIGGTVNQDGRLIVRVTHTGSDTALAQIVKLVENAQSSKPPVQKLADRVSAVFVPSVLIIALITAIGWYLWGHGHGWAPSATASAMAKAVCSVLIIACPCALGLAVPATVMVGTGMGARRGILMRSIDALEHAERIKIVVLDKTGTVTQGKPTISRVQSLNGMPDEEVLRLAASAEQYSAHPLAKAVVQYARQRNLPLAEPQNFESRAGLGVVAEVNGTTLLVGSEELLKESGTTNGDASQPATVQPEGTKVWIGRKSAGGVVERLGVISIADQMKPDSPAAIQRLHKLGMKTVLLTGDNAKAAGPVARALGIDDIRAQVKPDQKAAVIAQLQNQSAQGANSASAAISRRTMARVNYPVAMVGDGINDAAALATADLGIALGTGSDIAKESGDFILVSGSLLGVPASIELSRATMRKMRQNLFLAFIYNVVAIPLAAFGLCNPLIAAAAMALSDVTVIGNALLLRRARID